MRGKKPVLFSLSRSLCRGIPPSPRPPNRRRPRRRPPSRSLTPAGQSGLRREKAANEGATQRHFCTPKQTEKRTRRRTRTIKREQPGLVSCPRNSGYPSISSPPNRRRPRRRPPSRSLIPAGQSGLRREKAANQGATTAFLHAKTNRERGRGGGRERLKKESSRGWCPVPEIAGTLHLFAPQSSSSSSVVLLLDL